MNDKFKIVGLMLVKNEDLYIEQALRNILGFCDIVCVTDDNSSDRTASIIQSLAVKDSRVQYSKVSHPRESHKCVEKYAGTNTWVFGVDGDELYDPAGLSLFRKDMEAGMYDNSWVVFGNVLNCVRLDRDTMLAEGYLAPPCRSMTKLYNFNAINSWTECENERLHEGVISFKDGYDAEMRVGYHERHSWEDSRFRCLHLCFLKRSSLDRESAQPLIRKNIMDKKNQGMISKIKDLIGKSSGNRWKRDKYMRGELVAKKAATFFV